VKLDVASFPCPSTATHVTVVVPIGKTDPDFGVQLTSSTVATLLDAVGLVYVTALPEILLVPSEMLA
jgi:hypothetical protein